MTLHFQILLFQEFSHMKFTKIALSTLSAATLGFLALGVASTSAFAATNNTTTFNVTANVGYSCTLSHTDLAFGTVLSGASVNNDAVSTISVTCTSGDTFTVGLSAGTTSGSLDTARAMAGPSSAKLPYSLSSVASGGLNWGLTTNAVTFTSTSSTTAQVFNVYGRVKGADVTGSLPQGAYSDVVTINLTY
jgi:spore coat protein U-like protein